MDLQNIVKMTILSKAIIDSMQSHQNFRAILYINRRNIPKIHMEKQRPQSNSQSNPEPKEQRHRTSIPDFQVILQSSDNKASTVT